MTLVLALVGGALVVGVAAGRMMRRTVGPRQPRDIHWGDWPPDQMGR